MASAPPSNVARLPARPARPAIAIDGTRQPALEAALIAYAITDSLEAMARAELRFGNWGGADHPGFQHFDRRTLDFGKTITVSVGDDAIFTGRISAIAGHFPQAAAPEITVHAEDALQALRMTRRSRSFEQSSLGAIARRIAADHGLTATIEVEGEPAPLIGQVNQSDLAFLFDRARAADAEVRLSGTSLTIARTGNAPGLSLAWAGTLRQFDVIADLAHQRTAIIASGYDTQARAALSHRADAAAIQSELGSDQSGADILRTALGDRTDTIAHACPATDAEARQLAEAAYRHAARAFVTGEGICETDPRLVIGARLDLTGLGRLFDGRYRITALSHLYDADEGARSEFRCDRPGLGRP